MLFLIIYFNLNICYEMFGIQVQKVYLIRIRKFEQVNN